MRQSAAAHNAQRAKWTTKVGAAAECSAARPRQEAEAAFRIRSQVEVFCSHRGSSGDNAFIWWTANTREEVHNQGNVQTEEDGVDGEWNIVDEEEDQNVDQPTWSRMITSPRGQAVPVEMIEVALRSTSSPLSPLFTTVDSAGTPQAAFIEVIKSIGLSQEDWLKAASLSPRAAESISNITNMFRIERNSDNKLMLKYRAAEWNIEDCTVYLDNLPAGCTTEKICRIARKFGTVVEVRLPKSSSRQVHSSYGVIEMGKHSRSFAFLQFTEPET
ncbi:unnamed protein product [Heligmosomoides polygyrus]|uniref:RRM domain-containing protein n=1 Tax=Heligmosomoides polygyrus TaxID=6339 RepID=A0A183FT87_HELPZ|nr:unnamed protein product [Heligmosomoides polygyrus]